METASASQCPPPPPKVNIKRARLKDQILAAWDAGSAIAVIARDLECGTNTVRRSVDEHRPGERLARSRPEPKQTRECSGCLEELALDQFPPRTDRPGKHHAKCFACLGLWRRNYQQENPERNREGVRRRRARLRVARTGEYRDRDIYERDRGLCWFCREPVDLDLRYPEPMSMAVHHLHPIAKYGPDIKKNVAIAHYTCNQRAKDRYESPLWGWAVLPVPIPAAREMIVARHYLHRTCPVSFAFGISAPGTSGLSGVVTFGSPSSNRITRSVTAGSARVMELNRLWIDDSAPFGAGSYFLSRALRGLPPAIIVAYADTAIADPRYQTPHTGHIYRACSFRYAGASRPNSEWRLPGSPRNVGKHREGSERAEVSVKNRYWTVTGTKLQKHHLRRQCLWPVVPAA